MTREEAIDIIKTERECVCRQGITGECCRDYLGCGACDLVQEDVDIVEAYDMAIEVLKERPRVIPVATIKLGDEKTLKLVKEAVDRARPRGEWSALEYGYKCSACTAAFYAHSNFCPNCGADMRKRGGFGGNLRGNGNGRPKKKNRNALTISFNC